MGRGAGISDDAPAELDEPPLLERDEQLAGLRTAFTRAQLGRGSLLAVTGAAGVGKTALLAAAASEAHAVGVAVLSARGTELEREFAFGGVRQLLRDPADSLAAERFDGVALAAMPVLRGVAPATAFAQAFLALDGLTAVLATLTESGPIALLIDDAHLLDVSTLRWLEYVRARVAELPVAIVLALREAPADDPAARLRRELLADPSVSVLRVGPLSEAATATLLRRRLGREPGPQLVAGCAAATGGNAFVLSELIASLGDPQLASPEPGAWLTKRVPHTVARSILGRLARLDPDATAVAQALAVLGDGAPVRRIASLAGLTGARTSELADALIASELLAAARPPAFEHPLVRAAVYDDIATGARARLHAGAATLLDDDGAEPEAIAAHLLRSDPAGAPRVVTLLRRAAEVAVNRGAPETAAVYLRRAAAEPPGPPKRGAVSHELGHAELLAREPEAVAHLRQALDGAEDDDTRARIGLDLFDALTFGGRWREGLHVVETLADELGDTEPALTLRTRAALGMIDHAAGGDEELGRLEALADRDDRARPLLILLGLLLALRGERCDEVPALVRRGLHRGRLLAERGADEILAVHAVDALVFVDELDAAQALTEAMCDDAARRGLVLGAVAGGAHRGLVALRRGRLDDAERDLRDALETAIRHALVFTVPFIRAYLAETLAHRGELDQAADQLEAVPDESLAFSNPAAVTVLAVRGAVALERRDHEAAIADLGRCGEIAAEMGAVNPSAVRWRSPLARALALVGDGDRDGDRVRDRLARARALIDEELDAARRSGSDRGAGVALHAAAQLAQGDRAIALLRESVRTLAGSPATLERAAALADLGAALRRAGRIQAARAALREALQEATANGQATLAQRITDELHAAGGRPRRPWHSGAGALTPSELRVARLAAQGLTNDEIAAELVIATKTVKSHLTATYRKLGIRSRAQLDLLALDRPEMAPVPGSSGRVVSR